MLIPEKSICLTRMPGKLSLQDAGQGKIVCVYKKKKEFLMQYASPFYSTNIIKEKGISGRGS